MTDYVHGYHPTEANRLSDQARTLSDLLHGDTRFAPEETVLEVGCGVGAQTVLLTQNSPNTHFVSIDISAQSIAAAKQRGLVNVRFEQAGLFDLTERDGRYDHVFICFVLEHLPHPVRALEHIKTLLKPGGTLTVIEGDHGSFYCHPETAASKQAVQCLIDLQARCGGNALIGRELYPVLTQAGFHSVQVSPRLVYVDASRSTWVEGFSRKTFIAMVEGVRDQAISQCLIDADTWNQGIHDLHRSTESDGVFLYTFFKGFARIHKHT